MLGFVCVSLNLVQTDRQKGCHIIIVNHIWQSYWADMVKHVTPRVDEVSTDVWSTWVYVGGLKRMSGWFDLTVEKKERKKKKYFWDSPKSHPISELPVRSRLIANLKLCVHSVEVVSHTHFQIDETPMCAGKRTCALPGLTSEGRYVDGIVVHATGSTPNRSERMRTMPTAQHFWHGSFELVSERLRGGRGASFAEYSPVEAIGGHSLVHQLPPPPELYGAVELQRQ